MSNVIEFLQAAYYVVSITWIAIWLFPKVRGMFHDKESHQSEDERLVRKRHCLSFQT